MDKTEFVFLHKINKTFSQRTRHSIHLSFIICQIRQHFVFDDYLSLKDDRAFVNCYNIYVLISISCMEIDLLFLVSHYINLIKRKIILKHILLTHYFVQLHISIVLMSCNCKLVHFLFALPASH